MCSAVCIVIVRGMCVLLSVYVVVWVMCVLLSV